MARGPRQYSATGFYHIVLRGAGKRIIFESQSDYQAFLELLCKVADEEQIDIIAYCLMSNHVHVVVSDAKLHLSNYVKRIGTSFAMRYNNLHQHVGPVFQGRFFSTPLNSDEQLLEAIRYVHQNPQKAKICAIEDYAWSSIQEYIHPSGRIKTSLVLSMFNDNAEALVEFCRLPNSSYSVPVFGQVKLTDDDAMSLMKQNLTADDMADLNGRFRDKRDRVLRKLRGLGIGVNQASRLTGIGRTIVGRAYSGK